MITWSWQSFSIPKCARAVRSATCWQMAAGSPVSSTTRCWSVRERRGGALMWILSCVWLAGGALIGALGHLAALAPRVWWRSRRASWWGLLAVGALAALGSGWLGTLVFGR